MQNTTNNLKKFSVLPNYDNPNDICNNGIFIERSVIFTAAIHISYITTGTDAWSIMTGSIT